MFTPYSGKKKNPALLLRRREEERDVRRRAGEEEKEQGKPQPCGVDKGTGRNGRNPACHDRDQGEGHPDPYQEDQDICRKKMFSRNPGISIVQDQDGKHSRQDRQQAGVEEQTTMKIIIPAVPEHPDKKWEKQKL